MSFHIPYNIFQKLILTAYNHVNMAWHYTPGIYCKPFRLLAMQPAFYQFVLYSFLVNKLYPVYNGKTDEVHFVAVPKFIFRAHGI